MSTVLELVDVASGAVMDTVTHEAGRVSYRTDAARDVVARLIGQRGDRRPPAAQVARTFAEVARGGWSNGYTSLRKAAN